MMKFRRNRATPSIAIIGAGFGGVAMGVRLREEGIYSFEIFEKSSSVGGVWWDNRYPGAEVDTPSVLYSYSFEPCRWTRTHVRQAELQAYIQRVAEKHGLMQHLHTEVEVKRVDWEDERQQYLVTFASGERRYFDIVISAVGLLSDPRYPTWPGLDSFQGAKFHTSRWDHSVDLRGKRVAIVGTGSTAVQVLPRVAESAGSVKLFQREPGWVMPKRARDFTPAQREALRDPLAHRLVRWSMLLERERFQYRNAGFRPGTPQNVASEAAARQYIAEVFADRPDLAALVTPSYPVGGKRTILTDEFYPALLRDNVELIPHAVKSVDASKLKDATGEKHEIDVLVMATGFKSSFVSTFNVTGEGGVDLHESWGGDERAFLGIMVPSFPNFFMLYGPNTNGGEIVTHLEEQARYITAAVKKMMRRGYTALDVDSALTEAFNAVVQHRLAGTSFTTGNNYFRGTTGRVITQWSDGALLYTAATRLLRGIAWRGSRAVQAGSAVGSSSVVDDRSTATKATSVEREKEAA